jgi:hypothetical protein
MMTLVVANEEDVCEVGICVGRSGAPYADAELISTLPQMTAEVIHLRRKIFSRDQLLSTKEMIQKSRSQ